MSTLDRCPEAELLVCCARSSKTLEMTSQITALLQEDLDWAYLLRMTQRHGMMPLLYWHLSDACPEAVPKSILSHLQDRFHANRLRNLYLSRELLELSHAFEAHGVPAIPYKGPVLATVAYGDLALREFVDLDILAYERDVITAGELLTAMGYQPEYSMSKAQEAAFLRYERQYVYVRDDGSMVELHWAPAPRYIPYPPDLECLWSRIVRVPLGGDTVPTFSPEDLLLILCVHGSVHSWERLSWICDVAELLRASEGMDFERLIEWASASNSKRMLLLGLFLANDLLNANLTEKLLREAHADAVVRALAQEVREQLFLEDPSPRGVLEGSAFKRFHFRMIERPADKLRYCVCRTTAPTLKDWALMPLPAPFFPCYRLLRPIRLTGRFMLRLAKRYLWQKESLAVE
jgi:hypothetical protein